MAKINRNPIYVTQPDLPPLNEFMDYARIIWDNKILTNNGPFHQEFERKLSSHLGVKHISLFSNGTLALITALQALGIKGEVITTPFSFVATTHSLWWNNIKPVFADIETETFNLDPDKVEASITPNTTAILPVHVYGNPCNLKRFKELADTYGLKIIYDAAHAFGVKINGESVLNFGNLSILSFHATKVFNSIEGGAIISPDENTKKRIDYLKNFGFTGETSVIEPGINAKMNELQAAYGILQLKYVDRYIEKRKRITLRYREQLKSIPGIAFLNVNPIVSQNFAYFPVIVNVKDYGLSRDELYNNLKKHSIFGRRYFYPLISTFEPYNKFESAQYSALPNAYDIAEKVICLPIYPDLSDDIVDEICQIIEEKS